MGFVSSFLVTADFTIKGFVSFKIRGCSCVSAPNEETFGAPVFFVFKLNENPLDDSVQAVALPNILDNEFSTFI